MKRYITISLFLILSGQVFSQTFESSAYPTGIYVFCGFDIPKHFTYQIERKSVTSDWTVIAKLNAPKSEAAVKARYLDLPASLTKLSKVNSLQLKKVWQQTRKSLLLDSLYVNAPDPRMQSVVGCAYLDEEVSSAGTYTYKVSKVNRSGVKTEEKEIEFSFPTKPYQGNLVLKQFKPNGNAVTITYEVKNSNYMGGVKLYRSPYLANKYASVVSNVLFTNENGKVLVKVIDASVAQGLSYSYYAKPYGLLGNMGKASDTVNVYNIAKTQDIGLVTFFEAQPNTQKQGVQLNWKLKTDLHITSIDVYRSKKYEKNYRKIASVSPSENGYFDNVQIEPAKAHFYYIIANNAYGYNQPSARTPAILKGNKTNLLPPQYLKAIVKDNIVTLSFTKVEPDTHGYYVYRANGYTGKLEQLPRMVISSDSLVTYTDTLQTSTQFKIYSYAVVDVNTSYNISPTSSRVSVQYSGGILPIPTNLEAMLRNKQAFLVWDNVSVINPSLNAYNILRTTYDKNENVVESERVIAKQSSFGNSYIDSTLQQGHHYIYKIQSVGLNKELSSPSLQAGVTLPLQLPLRPGKIMAFTSGNEITIQWDLPIDDSVTKVKVYRTVANEKASLLTELPATQASYIDKKARKNTMYFYYVVTENSKGLESNFGDPVSAIVR